MTTKELNRDCRRLILKYRKDSGRDKDGNIKEEFRKEFLRIYRADKEFTYLSAKNALALMKINQNLRIEPLHMMGIFYKV